MKFTLFLIKLLLGLRYDMWMYSLLLVLSSLRSPIMDNGHKNVHAPVDVFHWNLRFRVARTTFSKSDKFYLVFIQWTWTHKYWHCFFQMLLVTSYKNNLKSWRQTRTMGYHGELHFTNGHKVGLLVSCFHMSCTFSCRTCKQCFILLKTTELQKDHVIQNSSAYCELNCTYLHSVAVCTPFRNWFAIQCKTEELWYDKHIKLCL